MRLTGTQWDEATLHALGATAVAEVRDDAGNLTGYDVSPDIDMSDASLAAGATKALGGIKSGLKKLVDDKAEDLRLTLITPGSGQAMEYQEAYAEAQAALAALKADANATIVPTAYPMLAASIGFDIDPDTKKASTDVAGEARAVLAAYRAYQEAGAAIRGIRLAAKGAIDAASDAAGARAAYAAVVWPALS